MHGLDREARELRSVAPLLVNDKLVGPVTLVRNGIKVIGATDAELLRPHVGAQLMVATMLDGSATVPVAHWGLSRHAGLGLIELANPVESALDIRPIELGAVCASVDTRGTQAVLVSIVREGSGYARSWVPVQIDNDDGGGMADGLLRLASPLDDAHVGMAVDGASLFAWFAPNPALGRAGEVLVLGLAQAYRGFAKPRERPVIAEIVGLDDLGRALIAAQRTVERAAGDDRASELRQVAGEIVRKD
jgi:hypothetical protein